MPEGAQVGSTERRAGLEPWITAALILLTLKFLLFAFALPAFEGTDEPFHLDRSRAFAESPMQDGWFGRPLAPPVAEAVQATACGADLRRVFECPPFEGDSAWFSLLREPSDGSFETTGTDASDTSSVGNYQDHQPPLYYLAVGAALRAAGSEAETQSQLLASRLLAVLLVLLGVGFCFRFLPPELCLLLLAVLLLPGAAEALIRATNDTLVFTWCAALLAMLRGSWKEPLSPRRWPLLAAFAACGPLIKLTAIPVVAFAVLQRLERRRWWEGAVLGLGGLLVFPLQKARGWGWGGTLELNALSTSPDVASWWDLAVGLAHSGYTFFKTALWLGGWSVFRPPGWLVLLAFLLVFAWGGLARLKKPPVDLWPHLGAALLAGLAFLAFAVGKHRVFGVWGAVGGWYFWSWLPWLLLVRRDVFEFPYGRLSTTGKAGRWWIAAAVLFLVVVNVAWLISAHRLYGGG